MDNTTIFFSTTLYFTVTIIIFLCFLLSKISIIVCCIYLTNNSFFNIWINCNSILYTLLYNFFVLFIRCSSVLTFIHLLFFYLDESLLFFILFLSISLYPRRKSRSESLFNFYYRFNLFSDERICHAFIKYFLH